MTTANKRTTEAAVLLELGEPLEIMNLGLPELKPGQILVDVAFSGVCHSQLLEVRGKRGPDRFLPHCLGHEGSGIVIGVGPDVKKVKRGDHVVMTWIKGEGLDVPSTVYKGPDGPVNSGAISTFMLKTITCENRVIPIPEEMPLDLAALLGCAIPTGAGIIFNIAKITPGDSIAVFGVGGIGLSVILAADLLHASPIIAVDIQSHKLEEAQRLGATHIINPLEKDPVDTIMDLTGERGVDYAIESAGKSETMEAAFRSVKIQGGLGIIAGNLSHGKKISLDPMELIKGRRITGAWGGETIPDRDIPLYVDLYLSGKFRIESLNTQKYKLSEINEALDALEEGRVGRALIEMSGTSQ